MVTKTLLLVFHPLIRTAREIAAIELILLKQELRRMDKYRIHLIIYIRRHEDMIQAVLEGVAFGLRDSLEVARSLGIKVDVSNICGGGAKSPLWRKIVANIMNIKLEIQANDEGPALGGAILAAVGCGTFKDVKEAADKIFSDDSYKTQADILGRRLRQLGGVANIIREIKA